MPSLKSFRTRIQSVKSTQKITSAMKLVASVKLRKAEELAISARPFAAHLRKILSYLFKRSVFLENKPPLLLGRAEVKTILLVVFSSDRGLCGSFNAHIVREVSSIINEHRSNGKTVKLLFVGKKASDSLRRIFPDSVLEVVPIVTRGLDSFDQSKDVARKIVDLFETGTVDSVSLVYSYFRTAISREVMVDPIIPINNVEQENADECMDGLNCAIPEFEPSEEKIFEALLVKNIGLQIYQATLESIASEQGARMVAMDNATKNAKDLVGSLTLKYNQARQAMITKELAEVISGAEAI